MKKTGGLYKKQQEEPSHLEDDTKKASKVLEGHKKAIREIAYS